MRENVVEAAVRDKVKALGGLCLKWVCPGHRGVPDRIVLLPRARILFLELKKPGAKPEPLQRRWLEWLRKLGFRAEWADNAEEAMAMIVKTTEVSYAPEGGLEIKGVIRVDDVLNYIEDKQDLTPLDVERFRAWLEAQR